MEYQPNTTNVPVSTGYIYPVPANMGWSCPKCGRCYNPTVQMCAACAPPTLTVTTTTGPTYVPGGYPNSTGYPQWSYTNSVRAGDVTTTENWTATNASEPDWPMAPPPGPCRHINCDH
jgi:uncharacterized protein with LGFP repeats